MIYAYKMQDIASCKTLIYKAILKNMFVCRAPTHQFQFG